MTIAKNTHHNSQEASVTSSIAYFVQSTVQKQKISYLQ